MLALEEKARGSLVPLYSYSGGHKYLCKSFVPIHLVDVDTLHIRVNRSRPLGPIDVCKKVLAIHPRDVVSICMVKKSTLATLNTDDHKALVN